ncbi:MAG: J domain-containing protein [Chloroflexota bacterium]
MDSSSFERISTLRAILKQIRLELDKAEAKHDELMDDFRAFETMYEEKVGHLLEKLLLIEREVDAYLKRIKEMRNEQRYGNGYRPADEQFKEKWRHVPEDEDFSKRPLTKPIEESQIKKLYRQLARHYHPDLASDEIERVKRNEKMAAINDAYEAGSVIELMAFSEELGSETNDKLLQKLDSNTEKTIIEALENEIKWSRKKLRQTQQDIKNFHHRPLVEFALEVKLALREGRDLMKETALELEKQFAKKSVERDMLKSQFRHL